MKAKLDTMPTEIVADIGRLLKDKQLLMELSGTSKRLYESLLPQRIAASLAHDAQTDVDTLEEFQELLARTLAPIDVLQRELSPELKAEVFTAAFTGFAKLAGDELGAAITVGFELLEHLPASHRIRPAIELLQRIETVAIHDRQHAFEEATDFTDMLPAGIRHAYMAELFKTIPLLQSEDDPDDIDAITRAISDGMKSVEGLEPAQRGLPLIVLLRQLPMLGNGEQAICGDIARAILDLGPVKPAHRAMGLTLMAEYAGMMEADDLKTLAEAQVATAILEFGIVHEPCAAIPDDPETELQYTLQALESDPASAAGIRSCMDSADGLEPVRRGAALIALIRLLPSLDEGERIGSTFDSALAALSSALPWHRALGLTVLAQCAGQVEAYLPRMDTERKLAAAILQIRTDFSPSTRWPSP